jgi:hypothetical protein
MVAANIREMLEREPFVPFRVVMTSGRHYDVANPALVMVLKSEVFIAFPDGEHWAHVPFLHTASVETITNGRGKRATKRRRR